MLSGENWFDILTLFCCVVGALVAFILLWGSTEKSFSGKILGAFLFVISFSGSFYALTDLGFFLQFPHLWRTAAFPSLCIAPFAFLYVRAVLYQQYRFRATDLLYFVPAFLYLVNMTPFYLLTAGEKITIVKKAMADRNFAAKEPEGLLPEGWGMLFRLAFSILMVVLQLRLLWKERSRKDLDMPGSHNQTVFRWLVFFTFLVASTYIFLFVQYFLQINQSVNLMKTIQFTISLTTVAIGLYLLFKPEILYGMTGWIQPSLTVPPAIAPTNIEKEPSEQKNLSLTLSQRTDIREKLETHFNKDQPYLKTGYKLRDLADALNCSPNLLSAFINLEYAKNFNELINEHRVDHLEQMIRDSDDAGKYTLETLGRMVGFNSRSSFIAAVKKKTGKTPKELFSMIQDEV